MARSFSTTLVAAMMAQQTDATVYALLVISHPDLTTRRVVNNTEDVTSNGNLFEATPFSVTLPADSATEEPSLQVTLANVTLDPVLMARTIAGTKKGQATADLYFVEAADPDTVELALEDFEVRNFQYTAEAATFEMRLPSIENEPFPYLSATPSRCPGLF